MPVLHAAWVAVKTEPIFLWTAQPRVEWEPSWGYLCETDQHGLRQQEFRPHCWRLCLFFRSGIPLLSKWISVGDSLNSVKPLTIWYDIQCSPALRRGDGGGGCGVWTRETFQSFFLPKLFCDCIHDSLLKAEQVLSAPKSLSDRISL